jgi:DNA invertase Pin-like site-specific DNA recombinase
MSNCAIAYYRTSSATNVDGDSVPRQRAACLDYATRVGITIHAEFNDPAIKGADRLDMRPGFAAALAYCRDHDCRTIIVENASRFARDIIVQETGYRLLKSAEIALIASDDPDAFTSDTPTATMVRQILGVVAEFEKANLVAKLKSARDRKSTELGHRIEGRKCKQAQIESAKRLAAFGGSLRAISAAMAAEGFLTSVGTELSAAHVKRLLAQ